MEGRDSEIGLEDSPIDFFAQKIDTGVDATSIEDFKKMYRISCETILSFSLTLALVSCGGSQEDRPEEIKKLRALGVTSSKLTAAPSAALPLDTVTLTIHAAAPKGTQIAVTTFTDAGSSLAVPVETTVVPGSETYDTQYESLDLYSAAVLLAVPPATALKLPPGKRFISLRYGIELTAGAESERIVGSIPIYEPGSPEIDSWKPMEVAITKPAANGSFSEEADEDLEATITKNTEENVRVGWYVTGGLVKNRRAKSTSWETPSAKGKHLVIFTARGLNTGAFAMKTTQVSID